MLFSFVLDGLSTFVYYFSKISTNSLVISLINLHFAIDNNTVLLYFCSITKWS